MSGQAEELDLILIPGVAFDADCNRVSLHASLAADESARQADNGSSAGARPIMTASWRNIPLNESRPYSVSIVMLLGVEDRSRQLMSSGISISMPGVTNRRGGTHHAK